jgi:hypothetical protein
MDSNKDRILIGFRLDMVGDKTYYTSFAIYEMEGDQHRILESSPGSFPREVLVQLCFDAIKRFKPRVVKVSAGQGDHLSISSQTVAGILDGTLQPSDLLIGK